MWCWILYSVFAPCFWLQCPRSKSAVEKDNSAVHCGRVNSRGKLLMLLGFNVWLIKVLQRWTHFTCTYFGNMFPKISISGVVLQEPQLLEDGGIHGSAVSCTLELLGIVCFGLGNMRVWVCGVHTLHKVRNTRRGGLLFFAPPCSTWVFLTLWCKKNGWKNWCLHWHYISA